MYLLFKIVIFRCHVSFPRSTLEKTMPPKGDEAFSFWQGLLADLHDKISNTKRKQGSPVVTKGDTVEGKKSCTTTYQLWTGAGFSQPSTVGCNVCPSTQYVIVASADNRFGCCCYWVISTRKVKV